MTSSISIAVDELISLTLDGKWETAYEKFYADHLEKTDLDGILVNGKDQNIKNGHAFVGKISNVRDFSCAGKIVKDDRSFIVWSFDFDVEGKPFKVVEVCIQEWEEGKIVRERFFT